MWTTCLLEEMKTEDKLQDYTYCTNLKVHTELIWNSVLVSKNMCSAIDKPPVKMVLLVNLFLPFI